VRQSPLVTDIRADVTGLVDDRVLGRIARRGGRGRLGSFRVLLDDEPAGIAELLPREGDGAQKFQIRLPRERLATRLDMIETASGRKLLDGFDLTAHYRLRMGPLALNGLVLSGEFAILPKLGTRIALDLLHNGQRIEAGVAHRARRDRDGFVYAFTAPLPVLASVDRPYTLAVRGAGAPMETAATMKVEHRQLGLIGYVHSSTKDTISGWAMHIPPREERVALDLLADGAVVATMRAELFREDLRTGGVGDGRFGFAFPIPATHRGKPVRQLGVVIAGTGTHLVGSPVALRPPDRLTGNFDGLQGRIAGGWACDLEAPDYPLQVEIVCEGRIVGTGLAQIYRADVEAHGIPGGFCGFRIDLGEAFRGCVGKQVSARIHGLTSLLPGSPHIATENPNIRRFLDRSATLTGPRLARLRRLANYRARARGISIVMPVHNTPKAWLIEALNSVCAQWCENWELICVDDGSSRPHVAATLNAYAARERRIRVLPARQNGGIACATNFGIRAARFEYVAFMDHDDCLEPDAVYRLIRAIAATGADLLYSDEILTDRQLGTLLEVQARPAFSYDYYLSHPYFVHLVCVRTEIAHRVAGWDESLPVSADVDFVLRVLEVARKVAHVPSVLYRWRIHETSTGHARQAAVMETTKAALRRHLQRRGVAAQVTDGLAFNEFRIDWPDPGGRILIVIPTRNKHALLRACIESIERTADQADCRIVVIDHDSDEPASRAYLRRLARRHLVMPYQGEFNFSAMNNLAVRRHGADARFVLFLNNDIEALEGGWLQRLRSLAGLAEVGAVAPLLLYPDGTVQHAGVILGFNKGADHAMKFQPADLAGGAQRNPGYNSMLTAVRDFSAVTAACMMLRKEVFEEIGGFDEAFAIGFNDTDLCLRLREQGMKVLYDGHTTLLHRESATRAETRQVLHPEDTKRLQTRWARYLAQGDPFYNPLLDLDVTDHAVREDLGCKRRPLARTSEVRLGVGESLVRETAVGQLAPADPTT
jgi:GT2 family glycosyltransferase